MIAVHQLTKHFPEGPNAVDHVSFDIPAGSSVAVLGPSGCGKTTMLRLIAGLEKPDGGIVLVDGRRASDSSWVLAPHLRDIGMVFQTPALWPHLTVEQNILFGVHGLRRREARRRAGALLEMMELEGMGNRYPSQLSGGQSRRVALARALAPRPRHLLLDEPLTSLDRGLKWRMLSVIESELRREAACMLYVTHDPEEAERASMRVLQMESGRIPEQGHVS